MTDKLKEDALAALRLLMGLTYQRPEGDTESARAYGEAMRLASDVLTRDENIRENADRIVSCSSCGAPMIFLPTDTGKDCPTDAETVNAEDVRFIWGTHRSHFATCPNANRHRGRR